MILNVSGRTDIVAFYAKWFYNRYQEGFVDVRNPFYPQSVSRIFFRDVDAIMFCTKNPLPLLEYIEQLKHPILLHVTLTPYQKEIEPNVPDKKLIIAAIQKLAKILPKDHLIIRYDPIFLSDRYNLAYHIRAFERMCSLLEGSTTKIIVSFLDIYKNVKKNRPILKYKKFTENDYQELGLSFSKIAQKYGMTVQTCFEEHDLTEYGFVKGECFSHELAYHLTGKANFKTWTSRGKGNCHCVELVDIGAYNTCKHFCKYCYANYDERKVNNNYQNHDPNSSLLIGHLTDGDIIKERYK